VEFVPRRTILPPDLFERFSQLTFWADPTASKANVIATKPKSEASESTF
jgi:sulfotransferase